MREDRNGKRMTMQPATIAGDVLEQAIAHHQAGRLAEAEPLYRAVLQADPGQPDANHNLGVIAAQGGRPQAAVPFFRAAVQGNPEQPQYWLSLIRALAVTGQKDAARQALAQAGQQGFAGGAFGALATQLSTIPPLSQAASDPNTVIALMNAGRYDEMEAAARQLTARRPGDSSAWHLLGISFLMRNQPAQALESLERAVALQPDFAEAHSNLGNALLELSRCEEAAASLRRALELKPDFPEALNNMALALIDLGRPEQAIERLRNALAVRPDYAQTHNNLGCAFNSVGRYEEAVSALRRALQLKSNYPEAHFNLGIALAALGRMEAAVASYRSALALKPDHVNALCNLGNLFMALEQREDAIASYRRALEYKPDNVQGWLSLGNAFLLHNQPEDAIPSYRHALAFDPGSFEAMANLGKALMELRQFGDEAIGLFRRALEINPNAALVHAFLGSTLEQTGRIEEALSSFRRALELEPDLEGAFGSMLFTLNYHPDKSGEEIYAVYREYEERFGVPHRSAWRAHANSRESGRRLKVGYVSPDFTTHAMRHFLEPLLASHDKGVVEVYAYAELRREDALTARYKGYVEHWVATRGLSDEALAERIRADGIDILVDLAGHTSGNRLGVFARKPAPVSVSWLGYGYTTGLTAIDYFLTDQASAPAGSEGLFSEGPWRLATPCYVYRPAEGMGEVSALPARERGHITFGTLTRAVRINHRTIRVWSQILKRVEGARLVIDSRNFQEGALQASLAEQFAAYGIERERLEIGFHSPPWDVLRGMDIGLDCFPHNSGTTLFETLYMGVPYVTLAGRPSVGRLGSSVLEGAGHPEWIARTEAEYVEKAVALASDLPGLAALRAGLRAEMEAGALRDEAGFARKVEAAYREMFEKWASKPVGQ